ncbi:PAS domain S-box protein [Methanobacterium sp. SMA-27]|uniref:PAS domain S-box protein n=1 Tax=Methanobacterium sp. SMA-27 TaxID=1495336 RepID=UPI0009E0A512
MVRLFFYNTSLKNIFGYSINEIKGKHVSMLMPERFKLKFIEKLERFKLQEVMCKKK